MAIPLLVFDVNETLLDLEALKPHLHAPAGSRSMTRIRKR